MESRRCPGCHGRLSGSGDPAVACTARGLTYRDAGVDRGLAGRLGGGDWCALGGDRGGKRHPARSRCLELYRGKSPDGYGAPGRLLFCEVPSMYTSMGRRALGYILAAVAVLAATLSAVGIVHVRRATRPAPVRARIVSRRVALGDPCPCGGMIRRASSSTFGSFLGCTNYGNGQGCVYAWTLDGRRIRRAKAHGVRTYRIDP
jgi:hypothetical protein